MKKLSLLLTMTLTSTMALQAQKIPGTADSSFNGNGFSIIPPQEKSSTLVTGYLDTSGRPVLLGGSQNLQFKWSIGSSRMTTNGKLDLGYKNNGYGLIDFDPAANESIYDVFVTPNGDVMHTGAHPGPNGLDMFLYWTDNNGVINTNFALNGFDKTEVDPGYDRPKKIIKDKNSYNVVLGETPFGAKTIFVARYFNYGGLDKTFGVDGRVYLKPLNENNNAVAIIDRPQGGYYVICNTSGNGADKITVMSISNNGNYNIDLGGPGEIQFQYKNMNTRATSVKYLNGSLIIAGDFDSPEGNTDGFITRLETDGTINTTFNQTGYNFIRKSLANPADEEVRDMIISEDSSIFVLSVSTLDSNMYVISRFQPNGNVYGNFGNIGGHHHTYLPGSGLTYSEARKLLLDEKRERLYVLGSSNSGANPGVFAYAVYTGEFAEESGNTAIPALENKTLHVFPNPSKGNLNLNSSELIGYSALIYDVQGRLVQTTRIESPQITLDSQLENGVYFIRILTTEGNYQSKIILQR